MERKNQLVKQRGTVIQNRLDEHLDTLLDTKLRGDEERKMSTLPSVIQFSKETFGEKEVQTKIQTTTRSRRQSQIQDLQSELNSQHKRYRDGRDDENSPIV